MSNTDPALGHAPVDHDFVFDNFKYDIKIHYQPCVKVSIYFKKKPGISDEHFFKHWAHVHADLTVTCKNFGTFKCQRYIQHHPFPGMKEGLTKLGMNTLDYDGCSTFWFKTWEDFESFFTGPGYEGKLTDDCKHFVDPEGGLACFAGHDYLVFGNGIPEIDDQDGLTEYLPQ